jgi:hypothetical protein
MLTFFSRGFDPERLVVVFFDEEFAFVILTTETKAVCFF